MSLVEALGLVVLVVALVLVGTSVFLWVRIAVRANAGSPAIDYTPHPRVPWSVDGVVLGIGLLILVTAFFAELAQRFGWITLDAADLEPAVALANMSKSLMVEGGARIVACVLLGLWLFKMYRASTLDFGFRATRNDIRIGGLAVLVLIPPIYVLQAALNVWLIKYEHPVLNLLQESGDLRYFIPMAVVAVLVAPVTEEFLFRVVLQGGLESFAVTVQRGVVAEDSRIKPPIWPLFVSSVLFALAHFGQGPAPVTLFFLALGLGYLYRQTHSIWPSLIVHFSLNAITMVMAALSITLGDSIQTQV